MHATQVAPRLLLAGLTLATTGAGPSEVAAPAATVPSTFTELVEAARETQRRDLEAWHRYAMTRQVIRESLTADGRVKHREELVFRVTPLEDGFDEELIRIDGELPGDRLVARHRHEARFTRRYQAALGDDDGGGADAARDAVLRTPLSGNVADGGRQHVNGVACRRLLLVAAAEGGGNVEERLTAATEGTVWVSERGLHIVRAETRLARPISLFGFLGKLSRLDIVLESALLADGTWLPRRIQVTSEARVAGFPTRKRNTFIYDDHVRHDPAARAGPR